MLEIRNGCRRYTHPAIMVLYLFHFLKDQETCKSYIINIKTGNKVQVNEDTDLELNENLIYFRRRLHHQHPQQCPQRHLVMVIKRKGQEKTFWLKLMLTLANPFQQTVGKTQLNHGQVS